MLLKRKDMENSYPLLRIAIISFAPFTHVHRNGGIISYGGYTYDLISDLSKIHNLSFDLVQPSEGGWGRPSKLGRWSGMFGLVQRNISDMTITPFFPTLDRLSVLHFSPMVDAVMSTVLVGIPENAPRSLSNVQLDFDELALLLLICVSFLTIYFIGRLSLRASTRVNHSRGLTPWRLLEGLMLKGRPKSNFSHTERVLYVVWSVQNFFLLTLLGGNLIALMSTIPVVQYIKKIEDIVNFPEIQPIIAANSKELDLLKISNNVGMREIYRRIKDADDSQIKSEDYYNLTLLEEVANGRKCLLSTDTGIFHILNMVRPCRSSSFSMSQPYREMRVVIGYSHFMNRRLIKAINTMILRFAETRQIQPYVNAISQPVHSCIRRESKSSHSSAALQMEWTLLNMEQLEMLFYIPASLFGVAIFLFFLEFLVGYPVITCKINLPKC